MFHIYFWTVFWKKESLHHFQIFAMLRSEENGVCQHLTKKEFQGYDVDLSGGLVVQYFCNCTKCTQQQIDLDWAEPALCNCGDARTPMAPFKTCTNSRRRAHLLFFKPTVATIVDRWSSYKRASRSVKKDFNYGSGWRLVGLGTPGEGLPPSQRRLWEDRNALRFLSSRHHHTTSDLMKLLWDRSLIDIFPGDCSYA